MLFVVHELNADAFEVQRDGGFHVDAAGGGGEVIFARRGGLEVGVNWLAGLAEIFEVRADLLKLGPADRKVARLENDGANAAIGSGFAQRGPDIRHGKGSAALEERNRELDRRPLGDFAFEIEYQRRTVSYRGRFFAHARQCEDRDDQKQADKNDSGQDADEKFGHYGNLLYTRRAGYAQPTNGPVTILTRRSGSDRTCG